ncbi:hypothetical protein YC2023_037356 [Brassica napus]
MVEPDSTLTYTDYKPQKSKTETTYNNDEKTIRKTRFRFRKQESEEKPLGKHLKGLAGERNTQDQEFQVKALNEPVYNGLPRHSPPKNSLTTKPYHLQKQRHHRNKEVTVDDNGTAPRRRTDEPEPVEAPATKHRKQPPLLTHLNEEREPSLTSRSRQKSLLATRSCCNLQGKTAGRESSPPPEHPIEIQNRLHDQPPLTGDERQMDLERDRKEEHPQPRTRKRRRPRAPPPEHHRPPLLADLARSNAMSRSHPWKSHQTSLSQPRLTTAPETSPPDSDAREGRETTTESISAELERGRMRRDRGKEGNRERRRDSRQRRR